ncbi:MAG: M20 family metallo-hydrolase [Elusimicrobiota bacterium]|jgi:succinyl-diaminopimelate desuccinylase|nr:M20 family metallo-hydrolase [Elusimicrobiota bacterium]
MDKVFTTIDGMRDYVLELQKNMTRIPATSPDVGGKGEFKKAQYLEAELKKLKFDEIIHADAKDERAEGGVRPNIIAKYYGRDKTKTLWLLAHMDVVPEGDRTLWKTDPFEVTLDADGDTIYGRGVEDNQQAVCAAMVTAKAVMESGARPPVNLGIMLLSDEETGNKYGIAHLVKQRPDLFGKGDSFIVQDSGDPQGSQIEIAEKNILWFRITTTGKQSHASMPAQGNNAFYAASHLAVRLRDGLYAKFNKEDKLFEPSNSTFEPTKKEPNVPNVNTVPGTDVFCLDCRFLPSYDPKDVIAEAERIMKTVETDFKVKVTYEFLNKMISKATPADDPLIKRFAEAVEKIHGVKAQLIGIGGGTFAAEVRNLGLPAAVSSRIYENPHVPNEKSSLKFTLSDAKAISYILLNSK